MPLIEKLRSAFDDGGEPVRCQCLNCGSTFLSTYDPARARCPGCDSSRIRRARR